MKFTLTVMKRFSAFGRLEALLALMASVSSVGAAGGELAVAASEALPRICIVTNAAGAFFSDRPDGAPLLLRGFNYVRLRQGDHATFDAATKTTSANYDAARAESMLGALQSNGFNVVRVFIIGRSAVNPGIAGDVGETVGVFAPYMENVLDFLRRAERHRVHVFPTFGDGELPRSRHYRAMLSPSQHGANAVYFTPEGIAAKARYVSDFLSYLRQREPRLLTTLLGVQCQNELSVDADAWPFTVTNGLLAMPNGRSYEMSNAAQRRALMNDGLAHYHGALKEAVRAVDAPLLVAEGIFTQAAVGKALETHEGIWPGSAKDRRFPPDLVALGQGPLDFLDIHYYRTSRQAELAADFRAHMHSSRWFAPAMSEIRHRKPVILGEFGAFRFVERSYAEVVPNMVAIRELALRAGLRGHLYWTYDCAEQQDLYFATEDDGLLLKKL